jgi:hypothetical protein
MATRMNDFGEGQAAAFPAASIGGQKFAALAELVANIDNHGSKQALAKGSAKTSTGAKKGLRDSLRRQMKAIRDTAVSLESEQPGISLSFRIPVSNGDEELINSARAFVEAATPLKALFISREMPATFLDELTATIAQFGESVSRQNRQRGDQSAATASLKNSLAQVKKLRRELDPIVRNKFRDDPARLAMWESASRLERAPKRNASTKAPAGQQTPPSS